MKGWYYLAADIRIRAWLSYLSTYRTLGSLAVSNMPFSGAVYKLECRYFQNFLDTKIYIPSATDDVRNISRRGSTHPEAMPSGKCRETVAASYSSWIHEESASLNFIRFYETVNVRRGLLSIRQLSSIKILLLSITILARRKGGRRNDEISLEMSFGESRPSLGRRELLGSVKRL